MSVTEHERYPVKPSRHSSHSQIVRLCGVGHGRRLLDIGCARGHLSAALQEAGWIVTGIEPDPVDAEAARASGISVVVGSAEEALASLRGDFDVIVLADVLEHMVDPDTVLTAAMNRLAPGGRVIISIPNVAHLAVRLQLLCGSFTYTDRGILDRTHLHFYTRRTLLEMVRSAGLRPVKVGATPVPVEEVVPLLLRSRVLRPLLGVGAALARARKSLFAYQFIVVAERA